MLDYPLSVNTKVSSNRLSAISIESLAAPVLLRFTPSGRELFGTCCEDVANGFRFGVAAQRCLDWHCKFWSSLNVYLYTLTDQMEESFCHQIECREMMMILGLSQELTPQSHGFYLRQPRNELLKQASQPECSSVSRFRALRRFT